MVPQMRTRVLVIAPVGHSLIFTCELQASGDKALALELEFQTQEKSTKLVQQVVVFGDGVSSF